MGKVVHRPNHEYPDVSQLDRWKLFDWNQMKDDEIEYDQINDYFDLDRIQMYVVSEVNRPLKSRTLHICIVYTKRNEKFYHRSGFLICKSPSIYFCR